MENEFNQTDTIVPQPYYAEQMTAKYPMHRDYRKQLEYQAVELEKRAADIREVIAAFDANPELEKLLNAMRRLGV